MAKTTILLLLGIVLVVADQFQAAAAATQLSPAAEKSIADIKSDVEKVTDAVVSAASPGKQAETQQAVWKHLRVLNSTLAKAKESGDEKKIASLASRVKTYATVVIASPPDKRLKIMEESFKSVATPSQLDCPAVDKAYCEMHSKVQKAVDGVIAASKADKTLEAKVTVIQKIMYAAGSTINKAYADGDEKNIGKVLATYTKAADEVIAAAPAEKLNIMEKNFAAATVAIAATAGN